MLITTKLHVQLYHQDQHRASWGHPTTTSSSPITTRTYAQPDHPDQQQASWVRIHRLPPRTPPPPPRRAPETPQSCTGDKRLTFEIQQGWQAGPFQSRIDGW